MGRPEMVQVLDEALKECGLRDEPPWDKLLVGEGSLERASDGTGH